MTRQFFYILLAELIGIDVRSFTFSYNTLRTATNDFSSANKLGEGGFGSVYKVSHYTNLHKAEEISAL